VRAPAPCLVNTDVHSMQRSPGGAGIAGQTSASAGQIAASTQQLSGDADELRALVGQFGTSAT
jgi:hypothetical protein